MGMIMHDDVPYGEGTSYTPGTGIAINNNIIAVDADNTPTENSEKPVKSKGVYSALESNSAESAFLLKSTVGWTGKNLLKNTALSQTINGVTFTVNVDKSVRTVANNTSAYSALTLNSNLAEILEVDKSYILNGTSIKPSGTSYRQYELRIRKNSNNDVVASDTGRGIEFTITQAMAQADTYRLDIAIFDNTTCDTIFYPMIRKADITDDTYEPYHESVEEEVKQIYADNGVLGAKNLLNITTNSQTINGVTFTVNRDSKGEVLNVTVNGTATADTNFRLIPYADINLSLWTGKPIRLSGCQSGGSASTYAFEFYYNDGQGHWARDCGEGVEFTIPVTGITNINPNIMIRNGVTANNLIFYPMVRLVSDPDDTYVPYAMTNRELTEDRYYHAGDTVNVSLMNFAGLITNSSKEIRFTIPLMKDLSKITGITFKNTTTVGIRKPTGGYVIDGTISSGYNITILAKSGNLLSLRLTKTDDSAFDATNNTPLDVAFTGNSNDSVITFS